MQSGIPEASIQGMRAQIAATAGFWGSSVVRLQVEQDKLVGVTGHTYSPAYMADVTSMIGYARSLGLTVVINDQTEPAPGFTANEPMPTYATRAFWARIDTVYKNRPGIVYDLFNEPRGMYGWAQWKPAMQQVISFIRAQGAWNAVWVEGIHFAASLAGVPLLHGGKIVYTFHHPAGPPEPSSWYADFGYLAAKQVPVVDGEWAGSQVPPPGYLAYLTKYHVGLTGWTLSNGTLNAGGYATASSIGQMLRSWW